MIGNVNRRNHAADSPVERFEIFEGSYIGFLVCFALLAGREQVETSSHRRRCRQYVVGGKLDFLEDSSQLQRTRKADKICHDPKIFFVAA